MAKGILGMKTLASKKFCFVMQTQQGPDTSSLRDHDEDVIFRSRKFVSSSSGVVSCSVRSPDMSLLYVAAVKSTNHVTLDIRKYSKMF